MNKITPFLWFNNQAEEAMNFYLSVFKQGQVLEIQRGADGQAFSLTFEVHGQRLIALNGGPHYKFNEAISLFVSCEDQAEVDELWEKLTANGGEPSQCGWLKDKYGLSWQIVPKQLSEFLSHPDPEKARYALQAMLKMQKIVLADLAK
jgi:predicted 3-demethylubiquinone-9 3-methyltransferase (glyoxalase superfamily)